MQPHEVKTLVEHAGALMERFERRGQEVEQRQQALVQQLPGLIRQSADAVLQDLPRQVRAQVQGALEQATREYERRLEEAGARAQLLARQVERLERVHRHVVWKTIGAAGCALILLVLGGAALTRYYYGKMEENRMAAELLQLYNGADVAPCGEGRLCANVDLKADRFGDRRQYRPIRPR
ncbi:MAG TPA: relaxation protein [Lysobacter sp.]